MPSPHRLKSLLVQCWPSSPRVRLGLVGVGLLATVPWWPQLAARSSHPEPTGSIEPASVELLPGDPQSSFRAKLCEARGDCRAVTPGATLYPDQRLEVGERGRVQLKISSHARALLDGSSQLSYGREGRPGLHLERGRMLLEVQRGARAQQLVTANATLQIEEGRVLVEQSPGGFSASILAGRAELKGDLARQLRAGEELRQAPGEPAVIGTLGATADRLRWSRPRPKVIDETERARGFGQLMARRPGTREERPEAVRLASHAISLRVAGAETRTVIDETFVNQTDEVLEGILRLPLPPGAQLEGLSLDVDGQMQEGAFVERDQAAAIWRGAIEHAAPKTAPPPKEEIIWVPGPWRDPALLEWQRGGRFELRVFPIPKRGSRRVSLSYTERARYVNGERRLSVPLPQVESGGESTVATSFNAEFRGHASALRIFGYPLHESQRDEVTRLELSGAAMVPHGDLELAWRAVDDRGELAAWSQRRTAAPVLAARSAESPASGAGQGRSNDSVAMLALRPKLPQLKTGGSQDLVLVVDISRSMFGVPLRRAENLVRELVSNLDPETKLRALACDSSCQTLAVGTAGQVGDELTTAFASLTADGSSDLHHAIRSAAKLVEREESSRRHHIVYIGDAIPTTGPVRPGTLERALRRSVGGKRLRLTAVGIGTESDAAMLSAMARSTSGQVVTWLPGMDAESVARKIVDGLNQASLENVSLQLPDGLVDAAPEVLSSLGSGDELLVAARQTRPEVDGVAILRGSLDGSPFERRYPVKLAQRGDPALGFVARTYAAARISDLERRGDAEARQEAVRLSRESSIASRFTSLLVLESEAMFRAFGLERRTAAPAFTGEEVADASVTESLDEESEAAPSEARSTAASGPLGGGGPSAKASMAAPAVARSEAAAGAASPMRAKRAMADRERESLERSPTDSAPKPSSAQSAPLRVDDDRFATPPPPPPPNKLPLGQTRQRFVPMRRLWERQGTFLPIEPKLTASRAAYERAERDYLSLPDKRSYLAELLRLAMLRGDVPRAEDLLNRWLERAPLDADALTTAADLDARQGQRARAIRRLGGVVDLRPDDIQSQLRLARLWDWAGEPQRACPHRVALAEAHPGRADLTAAALRCTRDSEDPELASDLRAAIASSLLPEVERLLALPSANTALSGDLRVQARWTGDADVDLALFTPEGRRVSWLGAPTREVITATSPTSHSEEGLALRGAPPGDYLLEVSRLEGDGAVHGELTLSLARKTERVPFELSRSRSLLGVIRLSQIARLVPFDGVLAPNR